MNNPETYRRVDVLKLFSIKKLEQFLYVLMAVALSVSAWASFNHEFLRSGLGFLGFIYLWYSAKKIKDSKVADGVIGVIVFCVVSLGAQIISGHGFMGASIIGLIIPVIFAGILGSRKVFAATVLSILLILLTVYLLEVFNVKHYQPDTDNLNQLIYISVFLMPLIAVVWQTSRDIRNIIRSAWNESSRSEVDLDEGAFYDKKSGLNSRLGLKRIFENKTKISNLENQGVGLIRISFEYKLKTIYSHNLVVRDLILGELGKIIRSSVRSDDDICRIGYMDFLVLISNVEDPERIISIGETIIEKINRPLAVSGLELRIDGNIGGAYSLLNEASFSDVLERTEVALNAAEMAGKNQVRLYAKEFETKMEDEMKLIESIRDGLDRGEFRVVYQPRFELSSMSIVGCEALLRWKKDGSVVLPGDFIELAVLAGLSHRLDMFVMDECLKQAAKWSEDSMKDHTITINLSGVDFKSESFERFLIEGLEKYQVSPKKIHFEVNVMSVGSRFIEYRDVLARLRAIGHKISLDDSGSGHTTIAQLTRIGVDYFNVRKSYVTNVASNYGSEMVVQGVLDVAKMRNVKVIGKGVEDKACLLKLRDMGCNFGQGWHLGKEMESNEYLAFFKGRLDGNGEGAGKS